MPVVERLYIYPIKSLDGVPVSQATIGAGGALAGDREFAFLDEKGEFVNARRYPKIISLRARFDLGNRSVTLRLGGTSTYSLDDDRKELADIVGRYLGVKCALEANPAGGFPDDTEARGPTVLSHETLNEVARWFPGLNATSLLLRFRPSILITDCEPFWEDQLVGHKLEPSRVFTVGTVGFSGEKIRPHTLVPAYDPMTGKEYPRFQQIFVARRRQFLPEWAEPTRFDNYYRLAVSTNVDPMAIGRPIKVGDIVALHAGLPAL
jgi:uncharacterized protein YcbX